MLEIEDGYVIGTDTSDRYEIFPGPFDGFLYLADKTWTSLQYHELICREIVGTIYNSSDTAYAVAIVTTSAGIGYNAQVVQPFPYEMFIDELPVGRVRDGTEYDSDLQR